MFPLSGSALLLCGGLPCCNDKAVVAELIPEHEMKRNCKTILFTLQVLMT